MNHPVYWIFVVQEFLEIDCNHFHFRFAKNDLYHLISEVDWNKAKDFSFIFACHVNLTICLFYEKDSDKF